MSLELLKNIEQAEARADESRAEAQREARDILKAVEEACITNERNAALEHRAMTQRILEDAKATANRGIAMAAEKEAGERDAMAAAARKKLSQAADLIFERVVNHGAR